MCEFRESARLRLYRILLIPSHGVNSGWPCNQLQQRAQFVHTIIVDRIAQYTLLCSDLFAHCRNSTAYTREAFSALIYMLQFTIFRRLTACYMAYHTTYSRTKIMYCSRGRVGHHGDVIVTISHVC